MEFWHGAILDHSVYLDTIYKLQKRAVHNITKSDFKAYSNPLFKEFRLLNVRGIDKFSVYVHAETSNESTSSSFQQLCHYK